MSILWNMFQSAEIGEAKSDASKANIKSVRNRTDLQSLEDKIDALSLTCHAMWELLEENTNITSRDLERRVEQIDLRDGEKDGKVTSNITHCPDCGHKLNSRHSNCYWCGAKVTEIVSFAKS